MIGVCIVTYNQESYIQQAIDSVLVQENIGQEVRVYVGDDCSSDATGEICQGYGEQIIYYKRETNLGLVENTLLLLEQMLSDGCDYIAMLDGDDYWCDKQKLKKQIDFLSNQPGCKFVHTSVDILANGKIIPSKTSEISCENVFNRIEGYKIGNCSVVYESSLLSYLNFNELRHQGFMSLDYVMYAIFSKYTQFGYIPDHTAVWRRGHTSVSNPNEANHQIAYIQNDLAMWKYLAYKFPERWTCTEKDLENYYHFKAFNIAFRFGEKKLAKTEAKFLSKSTFKTKLKILALRIPGMYSALQKFK